MCFYFYLSKARGCYEALLWNKLDTSMQNNNPTRPHVTISLHHDQHVCVKRSSSLLFLSWRCRMRSRPSWTLMEAHLTTSRCTTPELQSGCSWSMKRGRGRGGGGVTEEEKRIKTHRVVRDRIWKHWNEWINMYL